MTRQRRSRSEIREWLDRFDDSEFVLADGLDDAFLGVAVRASQPPLAIYDARRCIEILMRDGSTEEGATEAFEFNTLSAWVGENTPLFLWRYKG